METIKKKNHLEQNGEDNYNIHHRFTNNSRIHVINSTNGKW